MIAVAANRLTRKFGDFTAVNAVSFNIRQGTIYGFLGPNGSGKSTTIRMLCGIIEPTAGSGSILGFDIKRDAELIKSHIGYMSQKFSLYDDLTVQENLAFYAGLYSLPAKLARQRIDEMLDMAGLRDRRNELAANLSGGWKQRLALGCAILHKPPILFLDEPTAGVDPRSRRMFWDIIYNLAAAGTTIMVTTHFMDEAEHCDAIGFIFEGNLIADDSPDNLKKTIPGLLLEIPHEDPMALLEAIADSKAPVIDSYPYGTAVHLLVDKEHLSHIARFNYTIIPPSLEDVFVFYVKSHRKELVA